MPDVKDAAVLYSALGLSVIQVRPDKKPLGEWASYQQAAASPDEVKSWFDATPSDAIAIICGDVSGGLAVLDVDDREYSDWLLSNAQGTLSSTWTVRTGSGKIHIYLYSQQPCVTERLKNGTGKKVADIRSNGQGDRGPSYVLAPPSSYDFNGIQGVYTTIYGGPDTIRQVQNAKAAFIRLIQIVHGGAAPQVVSDDASKGPNRILPPLLGVEAAALADDIRKLPISGKIRRTILEGYDPGIGDHEGKTASDVDFGIMAALREQGLTAEKIEQIWATFPIGDHTYRNLSRPHHGRSYLIDTTLQNVDAKIAERSATKGKAEGDNFVIKEVVRVTHDIPVYRITVALPSGPDCTFQVVGAGIRRESDFKDAFVETCNVLPILRGGHRGRDFEPNFVPLLLSMAKDEDPPPEARESGHLRTVILSHLKGLRDRPPPNYDDAPLGWRDESIGYAYIRGSALAQRVIQSFRGQAPKPERIWGVLERMGASADRLKNPANGRPIQVWRISIQMLGKLGG